jgi:hypothetical protein
MESLVLILRALHIVAGVFWVGAAVFYVLFVEPSIKVLGAAGPKFMQEMIGRRKYPLFMNAVSIVTILAGAGLIWITSGMQSAWFSSGPGIGFSLGALVGIAVWFLGFLLLRPRAERMGKLGQEIGKAGGPPTAEQAAEMTRLSAELARIGRIDAILLTIALVLMATARYWNF